MKKAIEILTESVDSLKNDIVQAYSFTMITDSKEIAESLFGKTIDDMKLELSELEQAIVLLNTENAKCAFGEGLDTDRKD